MTPTAPIPVPVLDTVLGIRLAIAWAGEAGDPPRLRWWRTNMVSGYGGEALLRDLAPSTWRWAVFEAALEAATRVDRELRSRDHAPDDVVSLFHFGHDADERLAERLAELKHSGNEPAQALRGLDVCRAQWSPRAFESWLQTAAPPDVATGSVGRRLRGDPPAALDLMARQLAAALVPLGSAYPLPHLRRTT